MALLQRLMKPRAGERIEVYKDGKLLIRGLVTLADSKLISISDKDMRVVNFRPTELEQLIAKREIRIKKL
jgi:hypothetical protein